MIVHCNLSEMKNKILPTCLQGNYRDSLGEFSNTSYGVCWAEKVEHIDRVFMKFKSPDYHFTVQVPSRGHIQCGRALKLGGLISVRFCK